MQFLTQKNQPSTIRALGFEPKSWSYELSMLSLNYLGYDPMPSISSRTHSYITGQLFNFIYHWSKASNSINLHDGCVRSTWRYDAWPSPGGSPPQGWCRPRSPAEKTFSEKKINISCSHNLYNRYTIGYLILYKQLGMHRYRYQVSV